MSPEAEFAEDPHPPAPPAAGFTVDLDGFEGPIDLLLSLARDQKVDLKRISILALAEQFLAFVVQARALRLELAADYLVMAAWLAYLKSRLLLPEPPADEEPSGEELAAILAFQLQRLAAMQKAGQALMDRPRLGHAFFARGMPEDISASRRPVLDVGLYDLLRAYGEQHARAEEPALRIAPTELHSIEQALARLQLLLGPTPDWQDLTGFLPPALKGGLIFRSALAATFGAGLEMVKEGIAEIRQGAPFGPIYLRGRRRDG